MTIVIKTHREMALWFYIPILFLALQKLQNMGLILETGFGNLRDF